MQGRIFVKRKIRFQSLIFGLFFRSRDPNPITASVDLKSMEYSQPETEFEWILSLVKFRLLWDA